MNNEKIGMSDKHTIKVHDTYEVEYWATKLGVSPDELLSAVEQVGNSSIDVKQYINSKL